MKAENLNLRPEFPLMKQSDIISFYHLQMPRWPFTESRYKALSLEAKVAYTFLLNRFQLSRMNGWVNEDGEVLQDAYDKLRKHTAGKVKNSTFYVMVVLFNCIWEVHSDLLVDPYLNQLAMQPPLSSRPGGDAPC